MEWRDITAKEINLLRFTPHHVALSLVLGPSNTLYPVRSSARFPPTSNYFWSVAPQNYIPEIILKLRLQ